MDLLVYFRQRYDRECQSSKVTYNNLGKKRSGMMLFVHNFLRFEKQ